MTSETQPLCIYDLIAYYLKSHDIEWALVHHHRSNGCVTISTGSIDELEKTHKELNSMLPVDSPVAEIWHNGRFFKAQDFNTYAYIYRKIQSHRTWLYKDLSPKQQEIMLSFADEHTSDKFTVVPDITAWIYIPACIVWYLSRYYTARQQLEYLESVSSTQFQWDTDNALGVCETIYHKGQWQGEKKNDPLQLSR
jgi:hypothetical protein